MVDSIWGSQSKPKNCEVSIMVHHVWGKFGFDEDGRLCRLTEESIHSLRDTAFGRFMQDGHEFESEVRSFIVANYGDDEVGDVLVHEILKRRTGKVLERSVGKSREDVMVEFIAECEALRPTGFKSGKSKADVDDFESETVDDTEEDDKEAQE